MQKLQITEVLPFHDDDGRDLVMLLGKTPDGKRACVKVIDYQPKVYFRIKPNTSGAQIDAFLDAVSRNVRNSIAFAAKKGCQRGFCPCDKQTTYDINDAVGLDREKWTHPKYHLMCAENINDDMVIFGRYRRVKRYPLVFYHRDKQDFIEVPVLSFHAYDRLYKCASKHVLRSEKSPYRDFEMYEAHFDLTIKFLSDIDSSGFGIIDTSALKPITCKSVRQTFCDFEYECAVSALVVEHGNRDNFPLTTFIFDIETLGPDDLKRYAQSDIDPVIQISVLIRDEASKTEMDRVVLCLKDTPDIPNGRVEWFNTESEMLERFIEIWRDNRVDIVSGFNTQSYDIPFMLDRFKAHCLLRKFLDMLVLVKGTHMYSTIATLGRTTVFRTVLYSLPGLISYDIYCAFRLNPMIKLHGYKLNMCCDTIRTNTDSDPVELQKKDDVAYDQIPALYKTREGRGKLAEYCMHDTVLCYWLLHKRNMIAETVEMCRQLTPTFINMQNQGLVYKLGAYLKKTFKKHGFVVPSYYAIDVIRDAAKRKRAANPEYEFTAEDTVKRKIIPEYGHKFPCKEVQGGSEACFVDNMFSTQLQGATVLDPEIGFFKQPVGVFDFASLYPSLIRLLNLCWTTLVPSLEWAAEQGLEASDVEHVLIYDDEIGPDGVKRQKATPTHVYYFVKKTVRLGVVPEVEETCFYGRKHTKKLMKTALQAGDHVQADVYNVLQNVQKIIMNSMYGILATESSFVPCFPMAASITGTGRRFILKTLAWIEDKYAHHGARTIYGDTDSVFILFDKLHTLEEVARVGQELEKRINNRDGYTDGLFHDPMDLEFEKILYPFIQCAKKRYVSNKYEKFSDLTQYKFSVSGLEITRRDNSELTRRTMKTFIKMVLAIKEKEAYEYVRGVISALMRRELPLEDFVITKALSKWEPSYNRKTHKHTYLVQQKVAMQMKADMKVMDPELGERIRYVWTRRVAKNQKISDLAMDPDIVTRKGLVVDTELYLEKGLETPLRRVMDIMYTEEQLSDLFNTYNYERKEPATGAFVSFFGKGVGDKTIRPTQASRSLTVFEKRRQKKKVARQANLASLFAGT